LSSIAVYVSGHGFGHATRVIEILGELRRLDPSLGLLIRTCAPRELFADGLGGAFEYRSVALDVGVIQSDSLRVDPAATLRAHARLVGCKAELVEGEVRALRDRGVVLVLADIPALAFDISSKLGVPGVAVANFSWDWIYRDYAGDHPWFDAMLADLSRSYSRADLLCRLPMACAMSAFREIVDVPLVARESAVTAAGVRDRLGLAVATRLVLLSFGGIGISLADLPAAEPGTSYVLPSGMAVGDLPAGYTVVASSSLRKLGLRYEDLVAAADVVMAKPGYGIVAECTANRTPMVYTSRGRFAEYPVLVEYLRSHVASVFLGNDDLRRGCWRGALAEAEAAAWPSDRPRIDGAEVVAERLAARL